MLRGTQKKNALLFHRSKLSFPHYLYTTHTHTALLFILSHFIANNFSFCEERKTTNTIIITCDVVAYAVAYTVFSRLVLVICLFHIEEWTRTKKKNNRIDKDRRRRRRLRQQSTFSVFFLVARIPIIRSVSSVYALLEYYYSFFFFLFIWSMRLNCSCRCLVWMQCNQSCIILSQICDPMSRQNLNTTENITSHTHTHIHTYVGKYRLAYNDIEHTIMHTATKYAMHFGYGLGDWLHWAPAVHCACVCVFVLWCWVCLRRSWRHPLTNAAIQISCFIAERFKTNCKFLPRAIWINAK